MALEMQKALTAHVSDLLHLDVVELADAGPEVLDAVDVAAGV
jgi:hypothetical protein